MAITYFQEPDSGASIRGNSSGVVSYNGDYGRLEINVSDVRSVSMNTIGPELFSSSDFATIDDLVTKLIGDDGPGIRAALTTIEGINNKLTTTMALWRAEWWQSNLSAKFWKTQSSG